jgi:hypothetical protein
MRMSHILTALSFVLYARLALALGRAASLQVASSDALSDLVAS